jgi:hypothetical protein
MKLKLNDREEEEGIADFGPTGPLIIGNMTQFQKVPSAD